MNAVEMMQRRLAELQAAYTNTEREHAAAQTQTAELAKRLVQIEAAFNEVKLLQGRLAPPAPLQVVSVDGSDCSDPSDQSDTATKEQ